MLCTSCNKGNLEPSFIEGLFRAHHCSHCEGDLILMEDYLSWKHHNPEYEFSDDITFEIDDIEDTNKAIFCPISSAIMQKYKLTAVNTHRVDYSPISGAVWLDKGEWEVLKQEGLAGSLNVIVSQTWQNKIRKEGTEATFAELYKNKFGKENYDKIKSMKEWLNSNPKKSDLIAYLLAQDPYSVNR